MSVVPRPRMLVEPVQFALSEQPASSGASDDRRGRAGVAVSIRSLRYAGVDDDITLLIKIMHYICRTVVYQTRKLNHG